MTESDIPEATCVVPKQQVAENAGPGIEQSAVD